MVSLETAFPNSDASIATKKTASGPPAPPSAFAAKPTGIRENNTIGGQRSAYPMAQAMAGPLIADASAPTVYSVPPTVATGDVSHGIRNCSPTVLMMVPISREQNSPCAMAPIASTKYRFPEITMSFRFKNAFTRLSPVFSARHAVRYLTLSIIQKKIWFCNGSFLFLRSYASFFADKKMDHHG